MTAAWPPIATRAIATLAVVLYLALSTIWLGQPGPYYDEWIFVPVSLRALGGCDLEAAVTHHLGCLPLTQAPAYVGTIKAWAMAPVLGVFGVGPWPVRLPPILLGLATLWAWHRLLRPTLGEVAAALVLLALAVDAAMIWHTRVDWGPFAIANACKVVAFAALLRWLGAGRTRDLAWLLAALCVGLYDKLNFLWMTAALGAVALLLEPRALWQRLRGAPPGQWLLLAAAAALHLFALWTLVLPAMNTPIPGLPTDTPLAARAAHLRHLYDVTFGASAVHDWMFAAQRPLPRWPWIAQMMLLGIAPFAAWALRGDASPAARLFRWSTLLILALLACLLATQQVGGSHHAIMLWPFPLLQAASLVVAMRGRWPRSKTVLAALAALGFVAFVAAQAAVHAAYARRLAAHGPYHPYFDPRLEQVAAFVRASEARTIVSAHWGLHVALLSLAGEDAHRGYRDWWPIFSEAPGADPARTAYLEKEFVSRGRLAVVEWTAPPLDVPTHADAYLAAWGACAAGVREFAGSGGAPLARVRLFEVRGGGQCAGGNSPSSTPLPEA